MRLSVAMAMLVLTWNVSQLPAGRVEHWSYERLLATADVVVLGKIVEITNENSDGSQNEKKAGTIRKRGKIEYKICLKGKIVHPSTLKFSALVDSAAVIRNGSSMIRFQPFERKLKVASGEGQDALAITMGSPDYLMFLKRTAPNEYVPVSGFNDSEYSFREVLPPIPPSLP